MQDKDKPAWDKKQHKATVPGNCNYSNAVIYGRKLVILGAIIVKGIRIQEFRIHIRIQSRRKKWIL